MKSERSTIKRMLRELDDYAPTTSEQRYIQDYYKHHTRLKETVEAYDFAIKTLEVKE